MWGGGEVIKEELTSLCNLWLCLLHGLMSDLYLSAIYQTMSDEEMLTDIGTAHRGKSPTMAAALCISLSRNVILVKT